MKKMLLVLTMASTMLFGQMGLSAYGGLNMANVAGDICDGYEGCGMKMGGAFGVQYAMAPVVLGAGISMRGTEFDTGMDEVTASMNAMYLDLSVLYPIAAGPGNAWVGLDLGMNLSASIDVEYTGDFCDMMEADDMSCSESTDVAEDVEMDYGLALGYTYPVNEQIGIYASYYMGLAEIIKDSESKHSGIGLGMTYALPF